MTSVNTQRIHLNTNDAELVDGNHANATFNLAKANLQCLCNQELSISLVKAVLPITIDAFGYNDDDTVAFTMKIIDSSFPDQVLKCFITKDTYDIPPFAATRPTVFKFPVSYLESPLSIQDILNKILASQYSGSSNISLIILKDTKRTAVQFDSGTITELVFDNSYVVKGRTNYNKPAQRLFTALGINTYDGEVVGGLVPTETIFKGGNGGIDNGTNVSFQYQLSLYHPPINLVSNLMLDSASSNGGGAKNNILAGIQIDVEDQSRVMECTHIGGNGPINPDPGPPSLFNGVPHDTQAFSIFDAAYYIFYKDYQYYIHNYVTNTTSNGVPFGNGTSVMTQIPTGQTINMGYVDAPNSWIYINVGSNFYRYSYTLSGGVPSFTYIQTISNASWFGGGMPTSGWDGLAPYSNGIDMFLFNGSSYVKTAYGGKKQPFEGLPHDIGCIDIRLDDTLKGWAFKGDKYYEISLTYSGIGGGTALIGRRPSGGTLVNSGTIVLASVAAPVAAPVALAATGTTVIVSKSSSLINHINHSVGNSHKIVSANSVSNLTLILENDSGGEKYSDSNIYYEIEFKTYDST